MPAKAKPEAVPDRRASLYDGSVGIDFYHRLGRRTHVYLANGQDVTSVTKILSVLDKPALINWAVAEMEKALHRHLGEGTVLTPEIVTACKGARYEKSEEAKTAGSYVHDWIEALAKAEIAGEPWPPLYTGMPAVENGTDAAIEWQHAHHVEWVASEFLIYSKRYNFIGTADWVARIDGELYLGDTKTNRPNARMRRKDNGQMGSGIYDEVWLQTAAYLGAYKEMGSPYGEINKRYCLRLGKEEIPPAEPGGEPTLDFETGTRDDWDSDWDAFLGLLRVYNWQKAMQGGEE